MGSASPPWLAGTQAAEQARRAELAHEASHAAVGVVMIGLRQRAGRKGRIEPVAEVALGRAEERPGEMGAGGDSCHLSIPLEFRLALGGEGVEGAAEIAGRHADRLGLGLGFDELPRCPSPIPG